MLSRCFHLRRAGRLGALLSIALLAACDEGGRAPARDAGADPIDPLDAELDAADLDDASDAQLSAGDATDALDGGSPRRDAQAFDATTWSSSCADPARCSWLGLALTPDESCAVREDHTLWCWGENRQGPEQIELRGGVAQMSSNSGASSTTCLVSALGDLMCRDQRRFSTIGAARAFEQVAVANQIGCAVLKGGKLSCWPMRNGFPERGVSATPFAGTEALTVTQVAVADLHVCTIDDQQRLWCWDTTPVGAADAGVPVDAGADAAVPIEAGADAGDAGSAPADAGSPAWPPPATPREPEPGQRFTHVAIGWQELCAVRASGELVCWTGAASKQLSFASPGISRLPGRNVRALALADQHGCAVVTDGSLWCWGQGTAGQLGNGSVLSSSNAVRVGSESQWVDVAVTRTHSCARDSAQRIYCWGDNLESALGTVTTGFIATPRRLVPDRTFKELSLMRSGGCAVSSAGELWCWGEPDASSIPAGTSVKPARIGTDSDWNGIMLQLNIACGLRGAGSVWCWGDAAGARLGTALGGVSVADTPLLVHPDTTFRRLYSDNGALCGIATGGALRCWGGTDARTFAVAMPSPTLVNVDPTRNYRSLAFGRSTTFGVTTDAVLWEWSAGSPWMQRGSDYAEVTGVSGSQCGVRSDGALRCWGSNSHGQLGSGTTDSIPDPTDVKSSERFASVTLSDNRMCALTIDGQLWCAGSLYNLTSSDAVARSNVPTAVLPALRFQRIAHDGNGACAIQTDGALVCWGNIANRSLGEDMRFVPSPVRVPLP